MTICREDLGRHNAFDKVVGAACARASICGTLIFSSGRLPVDMVMKAIHAGVPILATKAVPTDETIRLAREFDLTLICQARPRFGRGLQRPFGGEALGVEKGRPMSAAKRQSARAGVIFALALVVLGALVGLLTVALSVAVDGGASLFAERPQLVWLLPVAGLCSYGAYRAVGL